MACTLSERAPGASNPTAKNRVWGNFANSNKTHPANRRQSPQPRRKIRPTPTKPASGIPYWPSRDPIEERGGFNLYGFVRNCPLIKWDLLGKIPVAIEHTPALLDAADIVPNEISGTGKQSGTTYHGKIFDCQCVCERRGENGEKDSKTQIIRCNISFVAKIQIDKNQAKDPNPTLAGIYGHEQQHVLHRLGTVRELIEKVQTEDGGVFKSKNACTNSLNKWRISYYNEFVRIFPMKDDVVDDSHDPNAGDTRDPRPAGGEEFPPLPGSPYPVSNTN